jgi:hypothetical protein
MKRFMVVAVVGAMAFSALIRLARAQEEEPVDPRILAYDKGPAKIDVSKYPPDMKARYKVFTVKCGKCHPPARAINCDFVLEDEWERYIKRMMRKAGTFISPDEGKQIFEFVVYDSKIRKKALYDKKLKEAAEKPAS